MAIRGVLFDKDGTLIDVTGTWVPVYREMLAELMKAEPAEIDEIMAKAGYEPSTGGFRAGSTLAGGTTRELIDIWWPGLSNARPGRRCACSMSTIATSRSSI
jgi:phosphoglycolate phosphatase